MSPPTKVLKINPELFSFKNNNNSENGSGIGIKSKNTTFKKRVKNSTNANTLRKTLLGKIKEFQKKELYNNNDSINKSIENENNTITDIEKNNSSSIENNRKVDVNEDFDKTISFLKTLSNKKNDNNKNQIIPINISNELKSSSRTNTPKKNIIQNALNINKNNFTMFGNKHSNNHNKHYKGERNKYNKNNISTNLSINNKKTQNYTPISTTQSTPIIHTENQPPINTDILPQIYTQKQVIINENNDDNLIDNNIPFVNLELPKELTDDIYKINNESKLPYYFTKPIIKYNDINTNNELLNNQIFNSNSENFIISDFEKNQDNTFNDNTFNEDTFNENTFNENTKINEINLKHTENKNKQPAYSNLKGGSRPTYKEWHRQTIRKHSTNNIQPKNNVKYENTERYKKLNELKEKYSNSNNKNKTMVKLKKRKIKTIKYNLGKKGKIVSILLKNNETQKRVKHELSILKKKPISEIKQYLRDKNFIKAGSITPNNVLREMYQQTILTGDLINNNNNILLHNFKHNDEL
jgi:hypothetical protein